MITKNPDPNNNREQWSTIIRFFRVHVNLLWILQELFALGNEVPDNASFGL